jgi:hypothetical protein
MAKKKQAKRTTKAPARKTASSRKTTTTRARSTRRTVKAKRKPSAPAAKRTAKRRAGAKTPRKTAASAKSRLIVVTSGERPVHEVAGELEKAGFAVEEVLDSINQVTGRAAPQAMRRLKKVRGVTDVSPEHPPFSIGPPDAPIS